MSFFTDILLITVGLSMDSLAVSIAGGATIRDCRLRYVVKIALVMALFQGGLTWIGYLLGTSFEQYIRSLDHWVAFGLLAYLGGRMIHEGAVKKEEERTLNLLCNKTLVCMALATSIDALAVGISIAVLGNPIAWQAVIIGSGTFLASALGVCVGSHFGKKVNVRLYLIGGIILIAIGAKIVVEHLFFL
ncbi:MAG: manganese efflux pump MntP family protein [Tannerella sp.]|jgi:putative Mn2+ efflux pump MntP|nr:manganese efflux pump MntP family protein [Tannerella sp.]